MPLDFAADGAFVAVKLFGDFGDGTVAGQVLDVVSFVLGQLCVAHGNLSRRKGRMLPHTGLFFVRESCTSNANPPNHKRRLIEVGGANVVYIVFRRPC